METQLAQDVDFREVQKENPVLAEFNFPMAKIAEMRDRAKALTIASPEDKRGYNAVKEFRLDVRDRRIAVEKRHKEGKAEALEIGRNWDKAKNILLAELEPIEAELQAKQDVIDQAIQAEKDRRQAEINAKVKARQDALLAVEAIQEIHPMDLAGMNEADFQAHLTVFTSRYQAKKDEERKAAERLAELEAKEAERKRQEDAERQRVAKEQAERQAALDAQEKAQREAQAKLDADRKAIEDAKAAEQAEKARLAREEQIRQETEARVKREAEESARKAEQDRLDREKREAEEKAQREEEARKEQAERQAKAPDIEKLEKFLFDIRGITPPNIRDPKLQGVLIGMTNAIVAFDRAIQAAKQ